MWPYFVYNWTNGRSVILMIIYWDTHLSWLTLLILRDWGWFRHWTVFFFWTIRHSNRIKRVHQLSAANDGKRSAIWSTVWINWCLHTVRKLMTSRFLLIDASYICHLITNDKNLFLEISHRFICPWLQLDRFVPIFLMQFRCFGSDWIVTNHKYRHIMLVCNSICPWRHDA